MSERRRGHNLERVFLAFALNTEDVRKTYSEEFGFTHRDAKIDRKLKEIFEEALRCDPLPHDTKVPLYLLLALVLRKTRGRPKKITFYQQRARAKFLVALRRKVRQRKPGISATDTLWDVAKNGAKAFTKTFGQKVTTETMKRWLDSKPRPGTKHA